MPDGVPPLSIDEAIAGADVVMMLRVQRERLDEDLGDRAGRISCRAMASPPSGSRGRRPNAVVMHPGPMNRGVEIDGALADDPKRSLITLQVEMGVAVRMACLEMLLGLARGVLDRRVAGEPADEALAAAALQHLAAGHALRAGWRSPVIDRRQKVPLGELNRARIGK